MRTLLALLLLTAPVWGADPESAREETTASARRALIQREIENAKFCRERVAAIFEPDSLKGEIAIRSCLRNLKNIEFDPDMPISLYCFDTCPLPDLRLRTELPPPRAGWGRSTLRGGQGLVVKPATTRTCP